jgi:3alpha(or 20beta)-hydroxysteroid dehydrogenase
MGRVDGKVAVISGGARGMGASHARLLVAEGAKVVVGDILDDEGKALAAELGDAARYVHLDVTQPAEWAAAVELAVGEFGTYNVLVNNAGIVNGSTLQHFDLKRWQRILDVNLTGTFLGMQHAVEPMMAAGGGSIINVSSIEGLRGTPWAHGYVATKWGVRGLAKSAALELAPHNIRVNSIHPGLVRTPMTEGIPEDLVTIPLGRPAESVEVSTFVLFLASDESSYATGAEFVMDGGLVADIPRKAL